jgi:hypothetical protein
MNSKLDTRIHGRFFFLLILVGLLTAPSAILAQQDTPHHFASLQFLHPIATSPNPETTTNFRLSILYGRSGGIRGLDVNAIAGVNSGDALAFQITGLYARTEGLFQGLALTGGLQHLARDGAGFQFSGLANYVNGSFAGLQAAGLLNYTSGHSAGAQISGALNLNDGTGTFLQMASVANVNAGPANQHMSGGQVALLNHGHQLTGFQVGVMNFAHEFSGLQVGVFNKSRSFSGVPVGLVNMDDDSRKEWMFYGANLSLANIGFRSVLNQWSSIVSMGYGDLKGDVKASLFLTWPKTTASITRYRPGPWLISGSNPAWASSVRWAPAPCSRNMIRALTARPISSFPWESFCTDEKERLWQLRDSPSPGRGNASVRPDRPRARSRTGI